MVNFSRRREGSGIKSESTLSIHVHRPSLVMFTITPSKVNYVICLCGCIRHSFVRSLCSGSQFIASDRWLAELCRKPARLDNVLIPVSFSSKLLLFIKFEMPSKKLFKPYKDQRT